MQKEIARHKNAQDQREPRKIGLNINNPEIKGTVLIYKYPDGKEGLDSANIYWLRKGSQPAAKVIWTRLKRLSEKLSPTQ